MVYSTEALAFFWQELTTLGHGAFKSWHISKHGGGGATRGGVSFCLLPFGACRLQCQWKENDAYFLPLVSHSEHAACPPRHQHRSCHSPADLCPSPLFPSTANRYLSCMLGGSKAALTLTTTNGLQTVGCCHSGPKPCRKIIPHCPPRSVPLPCV